MRTRRATRETCAEHAEIYSEFETNLKMDLTPSGYTIELRASQFQDMINILNDDEKDRSFPESPRNYTATHCTRPLYNNHAVFIKLELMPWKFSPLRSPKRNKGVQALYKG